MFAQLAAAPVNYLYFSTRNVLCQSWERYKFSLRGCNCCTWDGADLCIAILSIYLTLIYL